EESDGVIPAPAGYRWVVACRYKDICFDKMLEYRVGGIKNEYAICKKAYEEGHNADLGSDVAQYSPEGMKYWGNLLYAAGESEKECLERRGGDMNAIYESLSYAFFTGEADSYDDWITCDYLRPGEEIGKLLQERFFADADPNDVIVSVDFHE
ncbi:MAG: hypothetical protein II399_03855, partial [Lachnospiraceae bacterium]|nr:hypothetical protein [Lachnospiraceae bacterium]